MILLEAQHLNTTCYVNVCIVQSLEANLKLYVRSHCNSYRASAVSSTLQIIILE